MKLIDAEKLSATLYKAWNQNEITNEDYIAFRQMIAESEESEISERDVPRYPEQSPEGRQICPCCQYELYIGYPHSAYANFCPKCGQAIDWDD